MTSALYPIHEIFASIQGEGAFVGEPQVFVRLDGCPLRCEWCDTPGTWKLPAADASFGEPEIGLERRWSNAEDVAACIETLDPSGARSVSVTGGEPLMWPEFVLELRRRLPARRLHLETAGAFPAALQRVLDSIDHVSIDHKLPADLAPPVPLDGRRLPGGRDAEFEAAPGSALEWSRNRRRLLPLLRDRDACAKLVVAGGRDADAYDEILYDHRELSPSLPLYLQPATPTRAVKAPAPEVLSELTERARHAGLVVRVVPQLHVQLGLR